MASDTAMSALAMRWYTGPQMVDGLASSTTMTYHRLKRIVTGVMSAQERYHSWRLTFSRKKPLKAKSSTCISTMLKHSSGSLPGSVLGMKMASSGATDHSMNG